MAYAFIGVILLERFAMLFVLVAIKLKMTKDKGIVHVIIQLAFSHLRNSIDTSNLCLWDQILEKNMLIV